MANAKFKVSDLKMLLSELRSTTAYMATADDIYDADNYPQGVMRNKEGQTREEAKAAGVYFSPDQTQLIKGVVKPVVRLVGDQGVYLMTNAVRPGKPLVFYAEGCDPEVDEDFYENKRMIFGGDDGVVNLPVSFFDQLLSTTSRKFEFLITPQQVSMSFNDRSAK